MPNLPIVGFESLETQIAGREVILFVVERIVGNVHLAIDAVELAATVDDRRRVVIHAGRAPLEQRGLDGHVQLTRDLAQTLGGRPRNRFGQIEEGYLLALAEVLGQEQLGQADELCTFGGGVANVRDGPLQVLLRLRRA